MAKISSFLIGMVVVGLFTSVLLLFMQGVNTNYADDTAFNSTEFEVYNSLNEMNSQAESLRNASDITEKSGLLDIIGGFFSGAYRGLKLTLTSFDTFDVMVTSASEDMNLGNSGYYFKIAISTIVLILIVVGVLFSAIVKRDL